MSRLLIVSNRLPVTVKKKAGKLQYEKSVGGLATALSSFYKSYNSSWLGWPGINSEEISDSGKSRIEKNLKKERSYPIFLSQEDEEYFYYGFSNKTVWPLFHYFPMYTDYSPEFWQHYNKVNSKFCEKTLEIATPEDFIWIQDYHLMLLPGLIREKMPDAKIGFFLHIPFPSFEIFRLLPWRNEILKGIIGSDIIGFHTYDYVRHFLSSVRRILGIEHELGQLFIDNRDVRIDVFPIGIDYEKFAGSIDNVNVQKEIRRIRKKSEDRKIILSIDRLDYTKGIIQRLEAFRLFLERNSEYIGKVTLIMIEVPSRTEVRTYRMLKKQVDELVGEINSKFGFLGWMPIWYLYRSLPFENLAALYNIADIALVTPLRDGMNLIAKEYLAARRDGNGVLILSEMAGAAKELGEALIVNPNNKEEIETALKEALTMPMERQIEANKIMQQRLIRYDVNTWANDFMKKFSDVINIQKTHGTKLFDKKIKSKLLKDYRAAKNRLILLDYDGTLVSFKGKPEDAKPGEVLNMINSLSKKASNEVVIISGRDKETLEEWFGDLDINIVAEHGVWLKRNHGIWETIIELNSDWKPEIKNILEYYVDTTPGTFIEEKDYSLVWHFRMAEPDLGKVRTNELKHELQQYTINYDLNILEGNKVIEIKNSGVNKGRAAMKWLSREDWDFILSIGDDLTDEDVFNILPDSAYSFKVGLGVTKAKYIIESVGEVQSLIKQLAR